MLPWVVAALAMEPAGVTCPVSAGASPWLAERDASERLAFLEATLPRARAHAQRWMWGWTTGFTALTAGQLAAIPILHDAHQTPVLEVNAASTALGAVFLLVSPPPAIRTPHRIEAFAGDPCARLAELERLVERSSRAERFGRSWLTHGGNAALNIAAGLVLAIGFDDWKDAWLTTAAGVVVGEVMIWTQPMDATRDLVQYRSGAWEAPRPRLALRVVPQRVGRTNGVALVGSF